MTSDDYIDYMNSLPASLSEEAKSVLFIEYIKKNREHIVLAQPLVGLPQFLNEMKNDHSHT